MKLPRSWCARRRKRHLERGTPLKGQPPQPFTCVQCHADVEPATGHAERRFCSYECKRAWHKDHGVWQYQPARHFPACRVTSRPTVRLWIQGACPECGKAEVRRDIGVGYCSRKCVVRSAKRRRRARLRAARIDNINLYELGQRDDWCCGICGEVVDATLEVPEFGAPTVDHVTPLAKGGNHSYANTQLAHFICNSLKGDTVPKNASPQLTFV